MSKKNDGGINVQPITPADAKLVLESAYERRASTFLWGEPGIGKSTIIKDFAAEHKMRFIDIRLTTLEPSDLRGLPQFDLVNNQVKWLLPEFIPTKDEPCIIFLDELTAADPRLQASAYELVLDRSIGGHKIPEKAWVLAAGNRATDGAVSYNMGTALADRFMHLLIIPDARSWLNWGREHNIHPSVLAFLKVKAEYLAQTEEAITKQEMVFPTPRSWERVSDIIKWHEKKHGKGVDQKIMRIEIAGYVGQRTATEFFGVLEEISQLPEIEDLLKAKPDKQITMVPDTITAFYGLAYSAVSYASDFETVKSVIKLFENLGTVKNTKTPRLEVQSLAMEMLMQKADKQLKCFRQLMTDPDFKAYASKISKWMKV